jgi:hypothetical protein
LFAFDGTAAATASVPAAFRVSASMTSAARRFRAGPLTVERALVVEPLVFALVRGGLLLGIGRRT